MSKFSNIFLKLDKKIFSNTTQKTAIFSKNQRTVLHNSASSYKRSSWRQDEAESASPKPRRGTSSQHSDIIHYSAFSTGYHVRESPVRAVSVKFFPMPEDSRSAPAHPEQVSAFSQSRRRENTKKTQAQAMQMLTS